MAFTNRCYANGARLIVEAMSSEPTAGQTARAADASEELARRSQALRGALTRYFARQAPTSEIDDLVQEVFLRIVKRGGTEGLDQFEAYVFETAASVLKDRHRRRQVRESDRHVTFEPEIHASADLGPDDTLLGRQALKATTRALMELPERTRTVFILRRLENLPYREIGRRLGLSVSAVEKHMLRATQHLMSRAGDIR
jgi:RNA polymerase sigma factor (sigma-70 family)